MLNRTLRKERMTASTRWGFVILTKYFTFIIFSGEEGRLFPVSPSYTTSWNRPSQFRTSVLSSVNFRGRSLSRRFPCRRRKKKRPCRRFGGQGRHSCRYSAGETTLTGSRPVSPLRCSSNPGFFPRAPLFRAPGCTPVRPGSASNSHPAPRSEP